MFAVALYNCALAGNVPALAMVTEACPDGLKDDMFAVALYNCALAGNVPALAMVTEACPDGQKREMFERAKGHCKKDPRSTEVLQRISKAEMHQELLGMTTVAGNIGKRGQRSTESSSGTEPRAKRRKRGRSI
ncbi:MAG: hypothetical protein AAGB24_16405 [Bacteroidota bacterium]